MGEVPLTPVMRWTAGPDGSYGGLAQAVLLVTPPDLSEDDAAAALQVLLDRHDMLRARLTDDGSHLVVPAEGTVRARDLLTRAQGPDLDRHVKDAAARLDPRAGRMLRAVLCGTDRLLLVAHHLVVDGVSWRIVLSGLADAWQALRSGQTPRPRRTGTSFRRWSHLLAEEARSAERLRELPWWTETLERARPLLDRAPDPARDTAATVREETLVLPEDVTAPLLTTVPAAYRAAVPDVLLSALTIAVAVRREERGDLAGRSLLVGLEGHGREEGIAENVDLSATVGWFTTFHPVALDPGPVDLDEALSGGPAAGTALKRVKEQLRAVPDHGLGYGLLRHLNPDTAAELDKRPHPQIVFNYLGRFTASASGDEPWELAPEAPMLRVPPDGARPAAGLEINTVAVEESGGVRLHVSASAPRAFLAPAETAALLALWERALRGLVRHAEDARAGGLTPSDLPLVSLTQDDIEDFESAFDFDHDSDDFDDFDDNDGF